MISCMKTTFKILLLGNLDRTYEALHGPTQCTPICCGGPIPRHMYFGQKKLWVLSRWEDGNTSVMHQQHSELKNCAQRRDFIICLLSQLFLVFKISHYAWGPHCQMSPSSVLVSNSNVDFKNGTEIMRCMTTSRREALVMVVKICVASLRDSQEAIQFWLVICTLFHLNFQLYILSAIGL